MRQQVGSSAIRSSFALKGAALPWASKSARARISFTPFCFDHWIASFSAPGFGQVAPHVYSAVCQNGVGLTKGTISGMLVADLACGVDNPLIADMQALGQPDALPPRPFLDVGVRARLGWELWRHRAEA